MLIYSEKITPRLQYIVNILFAGNEVKLTDSSADFFNYEGAKINYFKKRFTEDELLICSSGLLFETGIKAQKIQCSEWNNLKIFFQTHGDIPFDIFSAAFYLLSRYEEYLPHKKDSYGRYAHEESLAFKEGFLQLPLVNLWKQKFFEILRHKFPQLQLNESTFSFHPTYDIDIAFAYKGKSWYRKLVSKLKGESAIINGKDVFDVYDWLDELHQQHHLSPTYFFLVADRRSKYDKNLSPKSKELQHLIRRTAQQYKVGIHPSWQSFHDENLLKKEITRLTSTSQKKISDSRQHYIQFVLPHTYRKLIESGITDDYSMGYGSINGFRASYCSSFYWYDLMKEQETSLQLHPFCYMEANSFFEQKYSAEEAANELQQYHDSVKQVGGALITIFHNHFLTEQEQWKPWREMYEAFLQKNFPQQLTSPSLQQPL